MSNAPIRTAAAVFAVGAGLFATLGESGKSETAGTNNAPNANATTGSNPAGGEQGGSSKSAPIAVGTPKVVAAGWEVKVNSANLDADADLKSVNQFNTPQPGQKFVLANVTVSNKSDKPAMAMSNLKLSILPPSGIAVDGISSCMVSIADKLDLTAQMQPGSTATGNLCFGVKIADIPESLLLAEPQFTVDKVKDQQFFALK